MASWHLTFCKRDSVHSQVTELYGYLVPSGLRLNQGQFGGFRGAGKYAFLAFNATVASTMLELQKLCSITESEMTSWEVLGMPF